MREITKMRKGTKKKYWSMLGKHKWKVLNGDVGVTFQPQNPWLGELVKAALQYSLTNGILGAHLICSADDVQFVGYIRDNMETLNCPSSQKRSYLLAHLLIIPMLEVTCSGRSFRRHQSKTWTVPCVQRRPTKLSSFILHISQNLLIRSAEIPSYCAREQHDALFLLILLPLEQNVRCF